jgi:hypothetical protein
MVKLKGAGLCLCDEWEIFHEATQICHLLEITPDLAHVKSHKDVNIPYACLSRLARLNVDADRLAEAAHSLPRPVLQMMPKEEAALRINGHQIMRQFKKALHEAAGLQELKEDIIDQAGWSDKPDKFHAVDWSMHARAQCTLVRHWKVMVMKLQHDQLAMMYCRYWKNPPKNLDDKFSPRCPRCSDLQDINETMDHVLMCPCETALEDQ